MPILSTVLLTTKGDELEISATDLEIGFQNSYPVETIKPGSITISGKKLLDITRETNRKKIYISEKENNWVYISDNNAHYNLSCLPADEFPALIEPEDTVMIEIDSKVLAEMINKTIYSVTMEEAGFKLSGVFMEKTKKEGEDFLRMVATDGHRLSLIDKKVPDIQKIELKHGVMIPKKGLIELNKLSLEDGGILFGLKQNNLVAKQERALIIIRLLDTKFPDYKNVIPAKEEDKENIIIINRISLLEAMRRMMIVRSDQYQRVEMKIGLDYLEMVSVNPDLGNVEEKTEVKYPFKYQRSDKPVFNYRRSRRGLPGFDYANEGLTYESYQGIYCLKYKGFKGSNGRQEKTVYVYWKHIHRRTSPAII
jgi:DNA polymerase-3 subunit beta